MRGEAKQKVFFSGQQKLATVEAVDAFVRTAGRGDEFVYCEAVEPMRGETWARVGELVRCELVRSHQRRRAGGGFEYFIVRTGKQPKVRTSPRDAALADGPTSAILQILKRAADMGAPCPSDAELQRRSGLSTRPQAQWRVQRLIEAKLIESTVAYENGVPRRVVTIVETGKRTALPEKWAKLEAAARADQQPTSRAAGGVPASGTYPRSRGGAL